MSFKKVEDLDPIHKGMVRKTEKRVRKVGALLNE